MSRSPMVPTGSKRERRDRDSGLIFSWRLPVGNGFRFCAAIVTVAVGTVVMSSVISIRIKGSPRMPERRASLVILESGSPEAATLQLLAREAGPFPAREEPSKNPAVERLLQETIGGSMPPGTAYLAEWREPATSPVRTGVERTSAAVVLPSLPDPMASVPQEPPPPRPLRPVSLTSGITVNFIQPPPAELAEGERFLLAYDDEGRVIRTSRLEPAAADKPSSTSVQTWLLSGKVEGGSQGGGWLPVEVSP